MTTNEKSKMPTLRTERLILRPFRLADAPDVQRLAGDKKIASTTLAIPHPYEDGVAQEWILNHEESFQQGKGLNLAVTLAGGGELIGAIGLVDWSSEHSRAEIGYWIAADRWGQGFCSEAGREIVRFCFEQMGLSRVTSHHFTRNPASGCVMRKIGMTHEGTLRQHLKKWDKFEDVELYGILKDQQH